jgi:hypothetical protein
MSGDAAGAIADYQKAIALDPEYSKLTITWPPPSSIPITIGRSN